MNCKSTKNEIGPNQIHPKLPKFENSTVHRKGSGESKHTNFEIRAVLHSSTHTTVACIETLTNLKNLTRKIFYEF